MLVQYNLCNKQVDEYNKKCQIYISELHLCLSKEEVELDCEDIFKDLQTCNKWTDLIEINNKTIFK